MPNIDPNLYSLKVELALDSDNAFKTFDTLYDKAHDLQSSITAAVSKSIESINQSTDELQFALAGVNSSLNGIDISSSNITKQLSGIINQASKLQDSDNISESILNTKGLKESLDINKEIIETKKLQEALNDNQLDDIEASLDLNKKISIIQQAQDKLNKDFISDLELIINAINRKNEGHDAQNQKMGLSNEVIGQMGSGLDGVGDSSNKVANIWNTIYTWMSWAHRQMLAIDRAAEHFVTTNYRAYGSQEDLAIAARQLSAELGMALDNSLEVTKALMDISIPRHELDQYSLSVTKANRYLGISINTLADFARVNRLAGGDLTGFERQLGFAADAMRKFGLNSSDVQSILGDTSISVLKLQLALGGKSIDIENFKKAQLTFAGIAKDSDLAVGHAIDLTNAWGDLDKSIKLKALSGMSLVTSENLFEAYYRMASNLESFGASIDDLNAAADGSAVALVRLQQLESQYGITIDQMRLLAELKKRADDLDIKIDDPKGFEKLAKDGKKSFDLFNESMDTFTKQWDRLVQSLQAFMPIITWIIEGFAEIIKHIADFTQWISTYVTKFVNYVEELESSSPYWAGLIKTLKVVAAGSILVIGGFLLMGSTLTSLGGIFSFFTGTILSGLGIGLARLGASVAPVVIPLLGLSAALLITSVSAYVFASAVKMIADGGYEAVAITFLFVGAIGLLGLTLVGLGALAQGPIAAGMLVLGATFLMLGGAVALAGWGIDMAANALIKLADIANIEVAAGITMLATSLITLGAAALFSVPGIIALAGTTLLLIPALSNLAIAGRIFGSFDADGFASKSELVRRSMISLYEAGKYGLPAAGLLLLSGGALISAAFSISAGGLAIGSSTVILIPAVGLLGVAAMGLSLVAPIMHNATKILYDSSIVLVDAAKNYFNSGTALVAGSISLMLSGAYLTIAGLSFSSASFSLFTGVAALLSTALFIRTSAGVLSMTFGKLIDAVSGVYESGAALATGAIYFLMAGEIFGKAFAEFDAISVNIDSINSSLNSLHDFDASGVYSMAGALLATIPILNDAIDQFSQPVDKLSIVLDNFNNQADSLLVTNNKLSKIGSTPIMVDAIVTKPDAISTVQMLTESEESVFAEFDDTRLVDALSEVKDILAAMVSDNNEGTMRIIKRLLETYLPELSSLSGSRFNRW